MLSNSGVEFQVISNFIIDGKEQLVCKLPHPMYINGTILVSYVVLPKSEFKEFTDRVRAESDSITIKEPTPAESVKPIPNVEVTEKTDVVD